MRTRRRAERELARALAPVDAAPRPRRIRRERPAPTVDIAGLSGPAAIERWFASLGWTPHDFQRDCWSLDRAGRSGLVCVPTGAGKTYAAFGGPLGELIETGPAPADDPASLRILYLTPLRAVARDIELALRRPVEAMGLPVAVGSRTGDTAASERARQRERLPEILVTTPESLSLLLTRPDAPRILSGVRTAIVDEWHELLTSKRGVQVELALARLRRFAPGLRTWALSATVGRIERAAAAAAGVADPTPPAIVRSSLPREVRVESVLPTDVTALPWSGHFGLAMLEPLLERLDPWVAAGESTLVFTNTRAMAERWHAELLARRPAWRERLALHHGSLDRAERERVEAGLKDGSVAVAVATSSLDLGVDFAPVERVVQVGSPKGVARLLQRAGRAAHRPGATATVVCVPTHALELVEIAAARDAIARGEIEERPGLDRPLDCLVQHLVTVALGGGFRPDELFAEVRGTAAFAGLSRAEFDGCLDLVRHGGKSLAAYARFRRVELVDGTAGVSSAQVARMHRLNVGTITADPVVAVKLERGARLGSIEEDFVARLRPGDSFLYAGRMLEFVRLREAIATVRPARRKTPFTPHWNGARIPLSTALSAAVRRAFADARAGRLASPELAAAAPILAEQAERSRIPGAEAILLESVVTEEGAHLFLYPFEGRLVHEGLAALLALRLGRRRPATFAISVNDHGLELLVAGTEPLAPLVDAEVFSTAGLAEDLLESVNLGELGLRQFREIARVAGLLSPRYPGEERSGRELQAGATLLWEVLNEFEPESLLVAQARREVLDRQLEESRLARTLERLARGPLERVELDRPGPLAWPLMADRLGTTLSTESLADRIARFRVGGR